MRIEHLYYFSEVAHCHSINRAAKNLFITQPALTASLNALEQELGVQLLHRSRNGVVLTSYGEKILADSQVILTITEKWQSFSAQDQELKGPLHIVSNPAAYSHLLIPLVLEMEQSYPKLELFAHEAKNQAIPSYLENNQATIGILSLLPSEETVFWQRMNKHRWQWDLLFQDACQVLISTRHPLAQKDQLDLADLKSLTLAMYPEEDDTIASPFFAKYFNQDYGFHLSNLENILQVIVHNKAVGIFPHKMMQSNAYICSGLIKSLPIKDFYFPLNYYLLHPNNTSLTPMTKKMVTLIKAFSFNNTCSPEEPALDL